MYTDNPYRDWEAWEYEKYKWLSRRPVCDDCCEPIQDEFYYEPEPGLRLCERCFEQYVKDNFRQEIKEE